MLGRTEFTSNQRGQAITEYMMLLVIVLAVVLAVMRILKGSNLASTIMTPIQKDFARAYKYGHPQASGFDEGAPKKHVRIEESQNFRLYINPR